jgi:hypothetical protein
MENLALTTVGDYRKLLGKLNSKKKAQIKISISEAVIQISDTPVEFRLLMPKKTCFDLDEVTVKNLEID